MKEMTFHISKLSIIADLNSVGHTSQEMKVHVITKHIQEKVEV